jgi:DNA-binding NtrC family response regulator
MPLVKILFVDDEEQLRMLYCRLLSRESYEVICVESAVAALQILKNQPIDVLITDQKMSNINGIRLISMAKEHDPAIQCILISGRMTNETLQAAKLAGAFDCLEKPLDLNQLKTTITKAFEKRIWQVSERERGEED